LYFRIFWRIFANGNCKHYEVMTGTLLITAVLLLAGGCAVWLSVRQGRERLADAQRRADELKENYERRIAEIKADAEKRLDDMRGETDRRVREAKEEARQNYEKSLDAQKQLFDKSLAEMKASVNATTKQMLQESRNDFSEQSGKRIDEILTPLKDKLKEMKESMDAGKVSQAELKASMEEQIRHLVAQTKLTAESADELARALTHDPKYQGDWGERECEELLKSQGLREGYEYDKQVDIRYKDETGKERQFRPDFVLHLDQKRNVIVDAKVSLTAFKDYCAAEDEKTRHEALMRHIDSMEKHVKELGDKDYSSYLKVGRTMNFVIMFVPITGALWTALKEKPDMWRRAMEQHVYIADEQTLFAALSIIRMTWTKVAQLQHQEELYALATEMVKRVGMFYSHFRSVGAALDRLQSEYRQSCDKLEDKGNSIIVTANRLVRLGAKQSTGNYALPELMDVDDITGIPAGVPDEETAVEQ